MFRYTNIFHSKIFLSSVAYAAISFLQPSAESIILQGTITRQDTLNIVYFLAYVGYNTLMRYASDDEGLVYTPKGLPGKDRDDNG